jgi:cytochrome c oxidase assembly protein subunit 15
MADHAMTRFQRLALTAYICVEALLFVGAAVRASGSGLGCPDWPFCYGCWMPPTSSADIDFTKLDLAKFRSKAARLGRDPSSITVESLRAGFDPVATWVEYFNRLTSLPVGISVLALMIASVGEWRRRRPQVMVASVMAFLLVLVNAWLGARVVLSGLRPGIITVHMALAILLLCVLVYAAWRGTDAPWSVAPVGKDLRRARIIALVLFGLVVMEGIMGSQVREMTDELAMRHAGEQRALWVSELEQTWVYLIHRSFSWLLLGCAMGFAVMVRRVLGRLRWLEIGIVVLVVSQMVLGVILAHAGILRGVQILHIGLSSLLVSGLFLWLLASRPVAERTGVIEEVH